VEQLLKTTIEAAVAMKAVKPVELKRVTVDTTVQEKAIAHALLTRLLSALRHSRAGADPLEYAPESSAVVSLRSA
jgi:IS5 family transposase